jgi:hypothetical protein
VNGQAYGIVTFNLSDFSSPAKQFGIEVMASGEAMKRLEQKPCRLIEFVLAARSKKHSTGNK